MAFKKAVREKVWLKIGMNGTSGSGKSYSSLRVATGLVGKCGGSGIAYISTEKSRTMYYAKDATGKGFEYDVEELTDYSPESYIKAIDEAVNAGYLVIIIDSLSHGWQKLNDDHSKMSGNSFQNWGKLKPRWQKLMQKILSCPAHVIVCSRAKTEWAMEDKNGKQTPTKVGLGAEGDKQQDYEYTVSFMLQQGTHVASVDDGGKDNTGLYDGRYEVLTEEDGVKLYNWANSGSAPASAEKYANAGETTSPVDELPEIKAAIVKRCGAVGGTKNTALMEALAQFVSNKNPNSIKDLATAKACLEAVNKVEPIA